MTRIQISFNARTGVMFLGPLNRKIHGATFDKAHAVRVLATQGYKVTAEWLPNLTSTGYTTWVTPVQA